MRQIQQKSKENIYFTLKVVEVLAVLLGVLFAVVQIKDIKDMQSAELMLKFNEILSSDKNSSIQYAIEGNKPLFIENKGQFNSIDIDNYLGVFELMSATYRVGLLNNDMFYDAFSSIIVRTYDNKEIKNYLTYIREEDDAYFQGFEELAHNTKVAE